MIPTRGAAWDDAKQRVLEHGARAVSIERALWGDGQVSAEEPAVPHDALDTAEVEGDVLRDVALGRGDGMQVALDVRFARVVQGVQTGALEPGRVTSSGVAVGDKGAPQQLRYLGSLRNAVQPISPFSDGPCTYHL